VQDRFQCREHDTLCVAGVQISEDAALLQQLEGDSNSEDDEQDSATAVQVMAADMLLSDFDADKDPKSLSPGEMQMCLNEMQMAAGRSHGSVFILHYTMIICSIALCFL